MYFPVTAAVGRLKDKLLKRILKVLEPRANYEANFPYYKKKNPVGFLVSMIATEGSQ